MSRFLNSNTLSFTAGLLVGSVSSYFYCKYNRNSPCKKERQNSDDENSNESFVKQVGKIMHV